MPDEPAGTPPPPAAPASTNVVPSQLSLTDPGILVGAFAALLAAGLRKFGIIEDPTTLGIVISPFLPVIVGLFTHKTVTHSVALKHGQAKLLHVATMLFLVLAASMIAAPARAQGMVAEELVAEATTDTPRAAISISVDAVAPHWSVGTVAIGTYSLSLGKGDVAVGEQLGCVFAHVGFGGPNTYDVSANGIIFGAFSKAFAIGADICVSSTVFDLGICGGIKGNIRNGAGQTPGNGETWKNDFGFLFALVGNFPSFHQTPSSAPTLRFAPSA